MNLANLESFYITVKHNSISKAAKTLHLTQPGLSMQLQNLENELGVSLLKRSNKGVELTEEGKVIFDYANTLLSIQGNIERDLKDLHECRPKLKIGSCKIVGEYALPCSIYTFKHYHEEVDISMDVKNSTDVIEKLRNHSINIGIVQFDPKCDDIVTQTIISDTLPLVGNVSSSPDKIDLEGLKEIPIILREKESGTRILIEKALEEKGISVNDLNVIYDLNSPEAIKSSVLSGKGFSFLPKLIIAGELKKQTVKTVEIDDFSIPFNYYVAYRKNYKFSKYDKMFIDFIISSKRSFC